MMKVFVIFGVLAAAVFLNINCARGPYCIELLNPTGFRLLIPTPRTQPGSNTTVWFSGSINGQLDTEYVGYAEEDDNGQWIYQNTNASVKPGDRVNYRLTELIDSDPNTVRETYGQDDIPADAPRVPV